ncbi:type II toxin-antitoxin system antitoxin SocA domain-containing protein [Mycolicibacterium sp. lyk4-40-TYG-92]|uniref:Panacea domain-containing protein n=1 Tax=Mycolicibacterium sp. lyk4-40-TYG-92 TaxID=3040295 RepID=UPI002550BED3|nr:type II toxin-antitoxin system antitoxin SocA domain-containing protein [Mycolicibacterium sp. lyk4-40-TYG-92]
MANVHDVAAYILGKAGTMSTMKLQKLVYYCQGWSLAWDGEPIFPETIRAWANGPVVYELFDLHRGKFRVSSWPEGDAKRLTPDQVDTADAVLDAYGHLSGQQLIEKTHRERPWIEARGGISDGAYCNTEIELETMQDFFGGLATANEV